MRSRSTRPVPRSSPDPNTKAPESRRRHTGRRSAPPGGHRSARRHSTTPAGSTPRPAHAWDPAPTAVASTREGSKSEIIRPVLLDPWRAWEVAGSGQLFAEPIPRLRIGRGQNPSPTKYPSWPASLRTGWLKHRAAQLQVSASPSFNVTVLELIPATPRRTGNRSFLRVGLPAIEELARRLEATRYTAALEEGERWPHT